MQIPNVICLSGKGALHRHLPMEFVGWMFTKFHVRDGDWVFVMGDDARLPASVHVRAHLRLGVVFGSLSTTLANKAEGLPDCVERVKNSICDCNSVPPIQWTQGHLNGFGFAIANKPCRWS